MRLELVISGVGEVICALGGRGGVEDRTDGIADSLGGSLCGLAQPMLELGEELFDRVRSSTRSSSNMKPIMFLMGGSS
jgi:hypothetical protein